MAKRAKVVNKVHFEQLKMLMVELNDFGVGVRFWHVPRLYNEEADPWASKAFNCGSCIITDVLRSGEKSDVNRPCMYHKSLQTLRWGWRRKTCLGIINVAINAIVFVSIAI